MNSNIPSAWLGERNWPEPVDLLVQDVTNDLILTDALTNNECGTYLVDEANLEYLVKTVLDFAGNWFAPGTTEEIVDDTN